MPKNKKCQFKSKFNKDHKCLEPTLEGSDYCIFHKPNKTEEEVKLFKQKITHKLQDKDYVFTGYHFPTGTTFRNQTFEKNADFGESTFRGDANFQNSAFKRGTNFSESTFEADANFSESTFREWADFSRSAFMGNANFKRSSFEESPDFKRVTFNINISAEEVFRIAKTGSQRQGDYSLAGEYYYKERIARRKQLSRYSPKRWFEYLLLDGLCGYGERPLRAIRTGLSVVFGLALLYWRIGHIYPSPELFNEPDHALTFLDALYFSVVTFTTLGFGDWRPDPSHWIRYVVMSEAFIGAFLMALFIVTFARRMMR